MGKYGVNPFSNHQMIFLNDHSMSPIVKGLMKLKEDPTSSVLVNTTFNWTLGEGKVVDFWNDSWHASGVMSVRFNALYLISKF